MGITYYRFKGSPYNSTMYRGCRLDCV